MPWRVGVALSATAGGGAPMPWTDRTGPSRVRGQISLAAGPRSGVRRPGRATGAAARARLDAWNRSQLPRQALDAALEVGDSELSVDGLLEASDGVGVRSTRRTRRDECYTRVRHERVSLGASPRNAGLLSAGRQSGRAPAPGLTHPVPGLFDRLAPPRCRPRTIQMRGSAATGREGERGASSQLQVTRTAEAPVSWWGRGRAGCDPCSGGPLLRST